MAMSTKEVGEGTGLGLSMAYGIVRQHDGEIAVESPPGGGANFHIDIPALYEENAPGNGPRTPARDEANTRAGRVLAIDDDPHARELMRVALSQLGHQVDVARNAHQALIMMEDSPYQCLILDLKMPGMSGEDLFGIISRDRPDLAERVLFVTGDTVSPRTRDFLEGTGRPWLNKPVQLQEMAGEVAMVCESTVVSGKSL
jgi:CheY-like chemotaxis protein